MKTSLFLFVCLVFSCQLSAQTLPDSTQKTPKLDTLIEPAAPVNMSQLVFDEDSTAYRIKAGDKLRIRNLLSLSIIYPDAAVATLTDGKGGGNAGGEKPFEITVDKLGMIAMPRVGRIKVGGLTRLQAVAAVENAYSKGILTDPVFEVEITNLTIKVVGAVMRQGIYPLENEKMNLGQVLALAGGIDFVNADKTITIIRKKDNQQVEIDYNIRDLSRPDLINIAVYDGDYVFVPLSKASLKNVKYQRLGTLLQPIALTLNALAVLLALIPILKK